MVPIAKVLIFGASGMLGAYFRYYLSKHGIEIIGVGNTSRAEINLDFLNVTGVEISEIIFKADPDLVINCAAIVSVDTCSECPNIADKVNSEPVKYMVDACNSLAIPFAQISTDHYYDGDSSLLHDECYPLKILNYYAKTKKDGEDFALSYPGSLILRTNITGFRKNNTGSSFVEWLIDSLLSSDSFPLFTDYYTSTIDCLSFCSIAYKLFSLSASGIYNVASSQCLSKYEFGIYCSPGWFRFSTH